MQNPKQNQGEIIAGHLFLFLHVPGNLKKESRAFKRIVELYKMEKSERQRVDFMTEFKKWLASQANPEKTSRSLELVRRLAFLLQANGLNEQAQELVRDFLEHREDLGWNNIHLKFKVLYNLEKDILGLPVSGDGASTEYPGALTDSAVAALAGGYLGSCRSTEYCVRHSYIETDYGNFWRNRDGTAMSSPQKTPSSDCATEGITLGPLALTEASVAALSQDYKPYDVQWWLDRLSAEKVEQGSRQR